MEYLERADGQLVSNQTFSFLASNHDEISGIVEHVRSTGQFEGDEATAFAVGLKLFSEVMLHNKHNPLFTELRPQFLAFMKKLKALILQTKNGGVS